MPSWISFLLRRFARNQQTSNPNQELEIIMTSTFSFPWQHEFPPFYTLQTHRETRAKQLEAWRSVILDYCQKNQARTVTTSMYFKTFLLTVVSYLESIGFEEQQYFWGTEKPDKIYFNVPHNELR